MDYLFFWTQSWYLLFPIFIAEVMVYVFLGLVWVGIFNNYVVTDKDMRCGAGYDGEWSLFLGVVFWPPFAGIVLLFEFLSWIWRGLSFCLRPVWPYLARIMDDFMGWVYGR